ncbi:hypothetical protein HBH56_202820 [Parastagonospora nodorum]|uniref:Uncharacterized protein n=1 Tax=Phaeosphaeria nodorum (strain SN15 / ATCC MYA-4574 / FGSC 10173) TaxID=321614 RepID=A0A7U2FAK7_PHANO|nr:hypothetical protein HBH56_202820 [Parastagonospora nodorum]QRD01769.1 hypothetical protein JI435_144850 [Parastagonospora nodorum SN15]KAH3923999.1 hypothetical protein HBH54_201690 [Parastagonospora nodorum]KAH3959525.1 hypothetical protein HBH51_198150 [Parastagonospora nodorum]KAH4042651.1 hypothetical protein HBH49_245250 [Parastagonospora nodorum]
MALTKLVKMLLAFVLVALAAASNCDPSCRKIVLDCAKAIGPYNAKAIIPVDMSQCLSLLCKTWGEKCGDCGLCMDWHKSGNSTSAAHGVGVQPRTLTTSVVTEESSSVVESSTTDASTTETPESSTLKTTRTPKSSITTWTSAPTTAKHSSTKTKKHSTAKTSKHSTRKHSTKHSTATTPTTTTSTSRSLMTHSPPPSGPPTPPSKRDDPIHCGFGCNINECALVCMPQSYIDSYKKYPGNQWFDNNGAEVTVTLRSGVWKCNGGGCVRTTQTGECWTWCDQYGLNCQLMCKGKKTMRKRGHCWEMCDPGGLHCSITCNAEKEKRQCREVCDETGKCTSECVDEPKKTCWQACDSQGENCREECSVVGNID